MNPYLYLEHLSDQDLDFIARACAEGQQSEQLRVDPLRLQTVLRLPALYDALFRRAPGEAFLHASPFLVFAVLVQRAALDLGGAAFVEDWAGPGRRVPVFDVPELRDFAGEPSRQLFLAELLASYTRVQSGTIWVQTARGWRRRRFSELDLHRLLELIELVPENERPVVYRRLGDLSLFLSGVFPDFAARSSGIALLEMVGSRAYRMAARLAAGGVASVLIDVADRFSRARRILTFLTDRYLFPVRDQWFPAAGA
jgi:hypothetical protein